MLASVFLAIGVLGGPSQPPVPSISGLSQEKQNLRADESADSEPDQHGSEQSLPTMNETRAEDADRIAENKGNDQQDETPSLWARLVNWVLGAEITDWIMVAFTGALVRFTYVQVRYLWAEMEATRTAAEAAKETVDEMQLDRRAWLSVDAKLVTLRPSEQIKIEILFTNSGKTPALIRKTKIGFQWVESPDYDHVAEIHLNKDQWNERENVVAPGSTYAVHIENMPTADDAVVEGITKPLALGTDRTRLVLYVIATVAYSDFADGRESQALLIYHHSYGKFRQAERHNYIK